MARGTAPAVVLAGLTATALCLWSAEAAARGGHFGGGFGGGGMRFGGGHFGGGGMRFGGGHFGGGGMRFGGARFGGMRFGGAPFGGMRFGRAPFAGPRFGGMGGMRVSPRFGGAHSGGMRFGRMAAPGPHGFSGGARALNRPIARPHAGGMTGGQRAFAAGRSAAANRFTGMHGMRAATAGMAGGRFLHGQAAAAGGRAHAFAGHGLAPAHQGAFRHNAFASKVAWNTWGFRHHGCCGWFGKVFWPFVVGDVVTAVFWPWPWYEPFWGYGGDYTLSNVLWVGPAVTPTQYSNTGIYDIYGSGSGQYGSSAGAGERVANVQPTDPPPAAELTQACADLAPGVSELPIGDIERTVAPTGDQSAALSALKTAWAGASKLIKASCSGEAALTPVRRLDVVEERLGAVLRGLQLVSGPVENFHTSLSEAQKGRFDTMMSGARERNEPAAGLAGRLSSLCSERATSFSRLPLDKILEAIRPTESQRIALDALKSASARAGEGLNASCPAQAPPSLPDRLRAVEQRLTAMISALRTVRPALIDFYRLLSDEQKARFNIMGQPSTQGSNGRNGRQAGAN